MFKWQADIAYMGETWNVRRIIIGIDHLGGRSVDWRIILNWIVNK